MIAIMMKWIIIKIIEILITIITITIMITMTVIEIIIEIKTVIREKKKESIMKAVTEEKDAVYLISFIAGKKKGSHNLTTLT